MTNLTELHQRVYTYLTVEAIGLSAGSSSVSIKEGTSDDSF